MGALYELHCIIMTVVRLGGVGILSVLLLPRTSRLLSLVDQEPPLSPLNGLASLL